MLAVESCFRLFSCFCLKCKIPSNNKPLRKYCFPEKKPRETAFRTNINPGLLSEFYGISVLFNFGESVTEDSTGYFRYHGYWGVNVIYM